MFRGRNTWRGGGRESGFTLMELIIVCLLAGIFLTVSIPTLRNNLLINELESTARKIIGTVGELRNLAVRQHTPYLLHFDLDGNRLWYEPDGSRDLFDEEPQNVLQLPDDVRFADVHPFSQEKNNGGEVILWISKKGYMDQTVVHLSDSSGDSLSLLFSPFSGSARVYDEYIEIR